MHSRTVLIICLPPSFLSVPTFLHLFIASFLPHSFPSVVFPSSPLRSSKKVFQKEDLFSFIYFIFSLHFILSYIPTCLFVYPPLPLPFPSFLSSFISSIVIVPGSCCKVPLPHSLPGIPVPNKATLCVPCSPTYTHPIRPACSKVGLVGWLVFSRSSFLFIRFTIITHILSVSR